MTILLLLSMAWETVGSSFAVLCGKFFNINLDGYEIGAFMHEVIGTALILLFFLHLWLNRYWLKNLFRGRYNATRIVIALANVLLIIDVILLLISGVMMSKSIFINLNLNYNLAFARTAHILASYWGYVIMSFHVGLYWNVMAAMMKIKRPSFDVETHRVEMRLNVEDVKSPSGVEDVKSPSGGEDVKKLSNIWPHVLAVLIMFYGAYAFIKRQIGDYMFLKSQFVFFDFEEPLIYFLIDYIAIMILFACLGHYLILLFRKLKI